ncbi:hypothetical protein [Indioceanicola profundi]|uniref:hypothetical protein n=1 Tax=Indioceanicola profundi TaxID=2220096 RepID=UPI000E6AE009|nr:hypothetical protein [Indioceanicola profundi]
MSLAAETRTRGVVYGRSLDYKPLPPAAEALGSPIRLTDVELVQLPRKSWRDQMALFLQASGLSTIPATTRLRWQAHGVIDWLQGSLLGRGRGRRQPITHPLQLMPAIEFMMGLPAELDVERRMIHVLVGRALIEYRKRISQVRERPMLFAKEAGSHFMTGFKEQQLVSRMSAPAEQFQAVQRIYNSYYAFKANYIYSIICREPPESGNRLFSKFMRAMFFLSTIRDDGTIAPKPSYRALPPKEHVVFLAKRDMALQSRLRDDEQLRGELQQLLKYFRPLRGPVL